MVAVQAMGEEALAQVEPDALDGIHQAPSRFLIAMGTQLGAAGGQRQQRDSVRHHELRREVPAGLIKEQDGVHAGRQLLGEGRQEHDHGLCRGTWQGQGEGLVSAGPAGGEQIEAVVALVRGPRRADASFVPVMTNPAFLPDPGLVLTPELDHGLRMERGDRGQLRAKSIF